MVRRMLAGALGAVTAALLVGAPSPAAAHPGLPSGVFDPQSVAWASIRNQTPATFNAKVATYRDADYIPIDIDADASGASYVLSAVFQRNLDYRDWDLAHGLTLDEYNEFRSDSIAAGMRPADFETYVLGGVRYYNALYVENVEGYAWVSMRHMSQADWLAFRLGQHNAGRIIVDFDHYEYGGSTAYAAIAIHNAENISWEVEPNLSLAAFQNVVDTRWDDDYRLLMVDSTQTAGGQRFSGIFVRNLNGRGAPAQGQLTADEFGQVWSNFASSGNRLITQERYETDAGTRYLGVWRQND